MRHFELCVIGSGPGGQKAAIQAAKLCKSVCVIEKMEVVGGVAINTGTIPSKALRESILNFTRGKEPLAVRARRGKKDISIDELLASCHRIIATEIEIVRRHLSSNGIELFQGEASFSGEKTIHIQGYSRQDTITADKFIIAVGTEPARPESIPFDDDYILTSDELLKLKRVPRTMIVVGGGVIGTEYASMFADLGIRVTLLDGRNELIGFVDREVREALQYHLRNVGMTLRLGESVVSITKRDRDGDDPDAASESMVEATLESGKTLRADCLLYCVGRQGATAGLNLSAVGLSADKRGRIKVDSTYRSENPDIYAVGDVVGFPALASTSMDQGRIAACNVFGVPATSVPDLFPYGIYAVPEISMVGKTEEQLTREAIPYESGIAQYKEIARGQLIGDDVGMLKLLIHQENHKLLGVHAIGTGATELIHIGQAVIAFGGTIEYFIDTVFNYPTLAECYKVAALNALNKLRDY